MQRIHSFDATLTEGGLLTILRCPAHERRTYTPLPNTRLWGVEQKTHERAAYQSNVLRALKVGRAGRWQSRSTLYTFLGCLCCCNVTSGGGQASLSLGLLIVVHAAASRCSRELLQCVRRRRRRGSRALGRSALPAAQRLQPAPAWPPCAAQPEPYKKPVQLAAETEAVLVRCGEAERLLTRVPPRLERLPPEPPLLLLNGSQPPGEAGPEAAAAAAGATGRQKGGARQAMAEQAGGGGEEEEEEGARERASDAAAATPSSEPGGKAAGGKVAGGSAGGGTPERLNVLVIFIDSLGRRHFFRRMPQSAAALEAVARRGDSRLYQVRALGRVAVAAPGEVAGP